MGTVYVRGKGSVRLSQKDFVGSGGEGSIYTKGSTAYKIYADPSRMIPEGKIRELSTITDPSIIKPEEVVTNKQGKPLGYTMRFVKGAHPLCRLFTLAFKKKMNVTSGGIIHLVQKLQSGVANVHKGGSLIVDLNEMNFLTDSKLKDVYFIDVDSYQTRSFPATALMPSVRDWHTPLGKFTENSDWFSFAIVSFQLFIGIHPFKGKHSVKGLEERMKQGISVFRPEVKMPKVCFPLDSIPQAYRDWYKAVFEDGKRVAPPTDLNAPIFVTPVMRVISSSGGLTIQEVGSFAGNILGLSDHGGRTVLWTTQGVYVDQRRVSNTFSMAGVGFSPRMNRPVAASVEGDRLVLRDLADTGLKSEAKKLPLELQADDAMSYDGRIYVRSHDLILEVLLNDVGSDQVIASTRNVATVLPHASKMFPGVVIQNLLGSAFVHYFPRTGAGIQVRVPELEKYRIIEAKFDRQVLMVLGQRHSGEFDRLIFRFEGEAYDVRKVEDITPSGLNFVTLDTGVCVSMTEEDSLELFSSRRGSTSTKVIKDNTLGGDITLFQRKGQIVFPNGNKLQSMKM